MINFPDSPVKGDEYTDGNNTDWLFNGELWCRRIDPLHDADSDGNNYARKDGSWVVPPSIPPVVGMKLLQSVVVPNDDGVAFAPVANSTWQDVPKATVSFTPESPTSIIMAQYNCQLAPTASNDVNVRLRFIENSAAVNLVSTAYWAYETYNRFAQNIIQYRFVLDSWGTNAQTMKMQCYTNKAIKLFAEYSSGQYSQGVYTLEEYEEI